jgi:demethylmenaquinone methyltransferase/2-methoxy-6-polyprenyl-1,4-benzoquinol methylase
MAVGNYDASVSDGTLSSAFITPQAKRRYVRRLFATIADRYDVITVLLSFGRDRQWKRRLIELADIRGGDVVLDLACGTGDLAAQAASRGAKVIGLDITPRMIELARLRAGRASGNPRFLVGDMGALPCRTGAVDVVTIGYGLRNVPDLPSALREIHRVVQSGGRVCSLDFNRPGNPVLRSTFLAYLEFIGAALGWLLHRDPDTYRYIPASIRRYPGAQGVADLMRHCGFTDVRVVPVFGGMMTIHLARKAL